MYIPIHLKLDIEKGEPVRILRASKRHACRIMRALLLI